jgi:lysophospholipase L1-like esterase
VSILEGRDGADQLVRAGYHRIVVALGNMDTLATRSRSAVTRRIGIMLTTVLEHVPCVLWVDLSVNGNLPNWPERSAMVNQAIASVASEHGRGVIRWSAYSRGRDGWFTADGLHPNQRGQELMARLIATQVERRC